jgi:hypothetical protein
LARAIDSNPKAIEIQDQAVLFEKQGDVIRFLNRSGEELLQYTPSATDIDSVKNDVAKALEIREPLLAPAGRNSGKDIVSLNLSIADLMSEENATVQSILAEWQEFPDSRRTSAEIDLDKLPENKNEYDAYLQHLLVSIIAVSKTAQAMDGVTVRFLSSNPEKIQNALDHKLVKESLGKWVLQDVPTDGSVKTVSLVGAEKISTLEKGQTFLPLGSIRAGQLPNFKAYLLLGILAGRIDPKNAASRKKFASLYKNVLGPTQTGEDFDDAILGFLTGNSSLEAAIRYALAPIRAVEWTQALQFFRNGARMVARSA